MREIVHRVALLFCNLCIAARAAAASADSNWDSRFNLPGVDGNVYALATNGNNVYVGGDFISAGGNPAIQRIARWDGTNWFALGQGVNGAVRAIAVSGTTVYVGGFFYEATNTDGSTTNVYYVAQWNGTAWGGFGNGPNGFTGVGGYVYSLAVNGSSLYVAGNFPNTINPDGTYPLVNNIACWNGTTWSALGGGVNGSVYVLVPSGSGVCAGGIFTQATNSSALTVNGVAYWGGANWSALGTGVSGGSLPYVYVEALTMLNNNLYAGGSNANYVA